MNKPKLIKSIQIQFSINILALFSEFYPNYYRITKDKNNKFVLNIKYNDTFITAIENDFVALIEEDNEKKIIVISNEEFKKLITKTEVV